MWRESRLSWVGAVAYRGILLGWGPTNSVENRENGDLGADVLDAAVIWYKKFHFI